MKNIQTIFFGSEPIGQEITDFLGAESGIHLAASTHNASALLPLLEQYNPQLLMLEKVSEDCNIIRLIQKIRRQHSRIKLLVLAHDIKVLQIQQAISIGVLGYLLLDVPLDGLASSIRLVNSGKLTLSSKITQALLEVK